MHLNLGNCWRWRLIGKDEKIDWRPTGDAGI
jgi:hypothetical protein